MRELQRITIKTIERIGSGSQGNVDTVQISQLDGAQFVDKNREVMKNKELANKVFEIMYSEFAIARDLQHPNIIKYCYFVCQHQS